MNMKTKNKYMGFIAGLVILAALVFVAPLSGFAKENDNGKDKSGCLRAIGHLIAPGWIKHNGPISIREECRLPFGIAKKMNKDGKDTTAPRISDIDFDEAKNEAEVSWDTNEDADSTVFWDTDSNVDTSDTADNKLHDDDMTKEHALIIRDLSTSTTYYAVVRSTDKSGNTANSPVTSFVTKPETTDQTGPVMSSIATVSTEGTITVTWNTNENSTGRVYFGKALPVDIGTAEYFKESGSADLKHEVVISGLTPGTTYYLIVESTDTAGNRSASVSMKVATKADTAAPVLSSISSTDGSTTTQITWVTNEPATSKVYYSTKENFDRSAPSTKSVSVSSLVTNHSIMLSGLSTSTVYRYSVESTDASKNTTISSEQKFQTGS